MIELLGLTLSGLRALMRPREHLVLENLLLRHQLAVLTRPTRRRPRARIRTWDKLLWLLARRWCHDWRHHLVFVTPDTVVRWHRQGWRLFWRWKSRSHGGRPHLSAEIRVLIASLSRDNHLWGTERIRGELLKLGIVVSNRSMVGLAAQNFLAGAAGLAIGIAFIRGLAGGRVDSLGNFWVDVVRATLWVLLPISLIGGLLLVWQGVPRNWQPYVQASTIEGGLQTIPRGHRWTGEPTRCASSCSRWPGLCCCWSSC
jgi:hypothetical protein